MLKTKKTIVIAAWTTAFVALAIFYATAYHGHIAWQEQNQIFLNTPQWLASYLDKPAWLACLAGDWLTQFFIYPRAGAVILTLSIAAATAAFAVASSRILTKIATRLLTPLFAILMAACSMPASTTLSFFLCVAGGAGLGIMNLRFPVSDRHTLDLSPILVAAAYWAFGFGALLTALFVAAGILTRRERPLPVPCRILAAASALAIAAGFPALLLDVYSLPYAKAMTYPGLARPELPQMKFERRLEIADAFYNHDLESAKRIALGDDSPDDFTAFYYYLASAVQDSLPDNLLKYPVRNLGTLTSIGEDTPLPVINMMNDLYFELGDMTYAERAAMMRNVFSPRNRNVRMMRRLAEINLVSCDTAAALKYLRILDKTFAYSGWSRTHTPGKMPPEVVKKISRRKKLSNSKDNIRLGDNCRNILLELLESNPRNTMALDYLLCTDLLLKDLDTFKMDYDAYCTSIGNPRFKDLYQQALMVYLAGTGAHQEEWDKYIVAGPQLQLFNQYSRRRGDPAFSDTYWYYLDRQ